MARSPLPWSKQIWCNSHCSTWADNCIQNHQIMIQNRRVRSLSNPQINTSDIEMKQSTKFNLTDFTFSLSLWENIQPRFLVGKTNAIPRKFSDAFGSTVICVTVPSSPSCDGPFSCNLETSCKFFTVTCVAINRDIFTLGNFGSSVLAQSCSPTYVQKHSPSFLSVLWQLSLSLTFQ